MRIICVLAIMAMFPALDGCSRPLQATYAMPLQSRSQRLSHPTKVKWAKALRSRTVSASLVPSTLPSKKVSNGANARTIELPRGGMPASQVPSATYQERPSSGTANHYVVVDPVGNCAVVDARPADGLKVIGDKVGYPSAEAANEALKHAKAECKSSVESDNDSKFKAAQAKAEKVGVDRLTQKDIEGLSDEQIKRLRGY
jgi:hypothetical protein